MSMWDVAWFAVYYLAQRALEEPPALYGTGWEERETEELLTFVRLAMKEVERRGVKAPLPQLESVRITRTLRIYIGQKELKVRPMAKTVLLLFLKHPEGIVLKSITDYQKELQMYYRRVSRSCDSSAIDQRVCRMMDIFNNELNVSIARVNSAIAKLVDKADKYQIGGAAGAPKRIGLDQELVIWE